MLEVPHVAVFFAIPEFKRWEIVCSMKDIDSG